MQPSHIDHLVFTAPSLEVGVNYVEAQLGVRPQPGGQHLLMGTHNALLRFGERVYLEVIAINPEMAQPNRPRWFNLDHVHPTPRLAGWIASTDDIHAAQATHPEIFGNVNPMSRGDINWLITIPDDGSLPLAGIAPTLLQWLVDDHPASLLQDQGCRLIELEGFHPHPKNIFTLLAAIDFQAKLLINAIAEPEQPRLIARIKTPSGIRQLE